MPKTRCIMSNFIGQKEFGKLSSGNKKCAFKKHAQRWLINWNYQRLFHVVMHVFIVYFLVIFSCEIMFQLYSAYSIRHLFIKEFNNSTTFCDTNVIVSERGNLILKSSSIIKWYSINTTRQPFKEQILMNKQIRSFKS